MGHEAGKEAWFEVLSDLFAKTSFHMPTDRIARTLMETTDAETVAFHWQRDAVRGFRVWNPTVPEALVENYYADPTLMRTHPLLHWYETTRDPRAASIGRTPDRIIPRRMKLEWHEQSAPWGVEQQMSIPLTLGPGHHLAFILTKSGSDFTDADFELATSLQPLLHALIRQVGVQAWLKGALSGREGTETPEEAPVVLTGREQVVLTLLAQGKNASAIARQLAISERTVHKHLQHCYEKLRVRDRLSAVLRAQRLRLVP